VALGVIGRHRRTGEQKLPGRIDGIHRPPWGGSQCSRCRESNAGKTGLRMQEKPGF
jgi:hypothetical protein